MYQATIDIPSALDAMERNIKAIIVASGRRAAYVVARQTNGTTASITHYASEAGAIHATVNFPVLPAQHRISKDELDRWTGYFLHEVSHALWTDNHAWKKAVSEGLHRLVNGLEDPRIERLLFKAALATNSPDIIRALIRFVAQSGEAKNGACDPNDQRNLPWVFALIGRAHLGQDIPEAATLYARLKEPMRSVVDHALDGLRASTSTMDILKIARGICGRDPETGVKIAPGVSPPEDDCDGPVKGNPGKPGEGEASDDAGDADEASDDAGDAGEGEGSKGEGDVNDAGEAKGGGEGQGEGGEKSPGGKASDAPAEIDPTDMNEVILDPMSEASKALNEVLADPYKGRGHAEIWLGEAIRGAAKRTAKGILKSENSRADYSDVLARAQKAGTMRQQVARVIKSVETESYDRHRPSGRLDRFALAAVGAGVAVDGVYARRSIAEGYDTTVTVLCDGSGSMVGGDRLLVTATLALAIAQACNQQGVQCEILQFRSDGLRMIKACNQRVDKKSLPAFGRLAREATGGTPLSESLIVAAHRLRERGATKRKILFAITDGGCDQGGNMVRKAADYCEGLGVETVGLSIDSSIHGAFRLESRIDSNGDVARAGLGNLVRIMEGARS